MTTKKELLILHKLGMIDDTGLAAKIDAILEDDPVAARFYDRLDGEDDDPPESVRRFVNEIVQQLQWEQLWTRIISTDQHEPLGIDDYTLVTRGNIECTSSDRIAVSLAQSLAGAPQDASEHLQTVRSERDFLQVNLSKREIDIHYPEHFIPHGLAWVVYIAPDRRLSRRLAVLSMHEFESTRTWIGTMRISQLTNNQSPEKSHFSVISVTEEDLQRPEALTHVTEFVHSLPPSQQRKLAEQFLAEATSISQEHP